MQKTRTEYHYAIRYVEKHADACKAIQMAVALLQNRGQDWWQEVKKVTAQRSVCPNSLDGVIGDLQIGEVFANKAKKLLNLYHMIKTL